jgi:hypothetical protein
MPKVQGNPTSTLPKTSMTEVINFGGIQPSSAMGLRSSNRLRAQPNADDTQMERAMMIAQMRDNVQTQGTPSNKHSFYSFSDEQIIDKAKSIGISLGDTLEARLKSARLVKDIEKQRSVTFLNSANLQEQNTGEAPICLVVSRASNLCDDLYEDHEANVDVHGDISVPIPQVKSTRKKKSYDKTKVRRSDRIKFKRNNTRS